MMGDADIVREQLRHLGPERGATGEAALDALVAERDEQRIMREHADVEAQTAREQRHVAEAERDAAKANWDSMDAARLRAEANANVAGRIALEAAEADNARLREAIDSAIHNIGVPSGEYPAPIAHAYDVLVAALAEDTP